jgi:hypothetical protein
MKSVTMNKRRRCSQWRWKEKEKAVLSGEEEERNSWSVAMKEKKRMKQNKNKANTLPILKIKTRSRVVLFIWKSGKRGQHSQQAHWVLPSSNNYLMSVIHMLRTDKSLHAILYSESQRDMKCTCLGKQMCVCIWRRETERDAFDDRKEPLSGLFSPRYPNPTYHFSNKSRKQVTDFSTEFSRHFKVFTMHLHKADSKLAKYHYSILFKIPRYRKHPTFFLRIMRKTGPVAVSQYQNGNSIKQGDYRQR